MAGGHVDIGRGSHVEETLFEGQPGAEGSHFRYSGHPRGPEEGVLSVPAREVRGEDGSGELFGFVIVNVTIIIVHYLSGATAMVDDVSIVSSIVVLSVIIFSMSSGCRCHFGCQCHFGWQYHFGDKCHVFPMSSGCQYHF